MSKGKAECEEARRERLKREASDWVIRQSYDYTPEEQDGFFEWLAADPEHAELYATRRKAWKHLDVLADWRPEHSLKPNPDLLELPLRRRKYSIAKTLGWVAGLAASLALSFIIWGIAGGPVSSGPTRLASGEVARGYERHLLEDGSVVELNRGAQASVVFTDEARHVVLESGEAHFTIAKDSRRPFFVAARGVGVQALGTVFNVQISEDTLRVLVTEGRVVVGPLASEESMGITEDVETFGVQELTVGQRSIVDLESRMPEPFIQEVSADDLEQELSWLRQVLEFNAAPLSEIVLEFNRRNQRKIVIGDPAIEQFKLTAAIRPDNIDGFVELLQLTLDVRVEEIDDSVIVLRPKGE